MKRGKRRLLTGVLCLAMLFADADLTSLQVMASESIEENFAISDDSNDAVNDGTNIDEKKEDNLSVLKEDDNQGDPIKKEANSEDVANPAEGKEETRDVTNPKEGSDSGNDEKISPEENNGVDSELGSTEGKEETDGETEGDKTQSGENVSGETENVESESGEESDIEESDEESIEESLSENTAVSIEELVGDAETAMQGERAVTASGKCGDNLTWKLEDETLTISGTGEMYDYGWQGTYKEYVDAPWMKYRDTLKSLVMEDGLTSIGISAFDQCESLTGNLVIPDSVEKIGQSAFNMCSGFTGNLVIPERVTEIGSSAFNSCKGFTGSLFIPNSVTKIGYWAFDDCCGFTGTLKLGSGLTKIENYTFMGCSGFTGNLIIPNGITEIGERAFEDCAGFTGSLLIPSSVTKIGKSAFSDCSGFTGNLKIGNNVTEIGWYAFENCSGFVGDLIIPDSVIEIEQQAFKDCVGFTGNLIIGNGVKKIKGQIFQGCDGFTGNLTIGDNVTEIEQLAFCDCSNLTGNLIIPATVEKIGRCAFYNCSGFTGSLTIPDSVVQLGGYAFYKCTGFNGNLTISSNITELKAGTFGGCSNFTGDLIIPDSVLDIEDNDSSQSNVYSGVFEGCSGFSGNLIIGENVERIGEAAFKDCSGFTGNLTIGNRVTSIGGDAFDHGAFEGCSGFTGDLIIPDSVKSIGQNAFNGCSGFTGDLTIGNSVKSIGEFAFSGCSGFAGRLTMGGCLESIEGYTFEKCSGFTGDLIIPNSVKSIGDYAFSGCNGFTGSLTIPNSVTSIGLDAFSGCSGFTGSLTIPNSVTTIGGGAFSGCSGFTGSLTLSNNVTTIGAYAFSECSGFTGSLTIPNSVTEIGVGAFSGCSNLTGNLIIPDSVVIIGECYGGGRGSDKGAFENCTGFTGKLTIGRSVTKIGDNTFNGCGFTDNLIIPNNVVEIGKGAFQNCRGFTGELIIPDSVERIWGHEDDGGAFENCDGFTGKLMIGNNMRSIGKRAFYGCCNFRSIEIPSDITYIGVYAFGPFDSSKKIYWHCALSDYYDYHGSIIGGTIIYDDDVPEPIYLNGILIKRSDYESSEGDFPSDIQIPSDKAAIGAVDSVTGRLIRSAYIILEGQTYRTDADGVYYFSLGQSSSVKRLIGATADGYIRANASSMSVQHGKITTVSMTKIVSDPAVGGDDVQVPAGKFAVCVVDDNQKLIKNAVVEIDGDKIASPDGVYYADADSKLHYVSASAKGYAGYISTPVTFNAGGKFGVFLRWNEDYNVTYSVGKINSQDVFTQKICLGEGEYSTSNDFDFTKAASLLGKTAVLRIRDGIAMEIYKLEECAGASVSIVPDMSSFIYQDGRFSADATAVHVSIYYMLKDEFPKTLLNGVPQAERPKFELNSIRLTIDEGMKVRVGKNEGNALVSSESRILSVGETYSFDASAILVSKAKPPQPLPSYKMTVEASGPVHSAMGFQTFRVADADYKSAQTSKRPTAQGSEVSKASVTELLEGNILYNLEGTVLESQYFSKEQLHAIEKMLTLWAANIEAATDTAKEISVDKKFMMDVLENLKVNINPYMSVSGTTAQMRIKAKTKSYGERTFIFTLELTNFSLDNQAPFGRTGQIKWCVENTNGIPNVYQKGTCAFYVKPNADRFLLQLKELAFSSIKNVYNKTWGNKANKVAEMIVDKRILDIMNKEFGSVSDMCFKLMIEPTEETINKGGRKKSITKCPVDLYVYDGQGNIAGAIINDIAYPMDDGVLVYVEDGAKIVDYYADEYTVKFVGNDTGTMSHEICEYYSTGELIRQIEFNDIPLDDGKVYQETIPDFFFAPPEVYALEEEGQDAIYPDSDSYDEERPEIILVDGISVTPDTVSLKIGEEKTLETTITPEEASLKLVEWVSDNENIVTVSDTGIIRAISTGTAKIKAISVDGKYEAECTITVDAFGSDDPTQPDDPSTEILPGDLPSDGIIPNGIWVAGITNTTYTGNGITQSFRLYDKDRRLTEKQDYTVSYKNNKNAYTYTDNDYAAFENNLRNTGKRVKTGSFDPNKAPQVVIKMKGNYSGSQIVYYQIYPMDITASGFKTDNLTVTYSGKKQTPTPTLTWNGKALKYGTDFYIPEYDNAKKDNTAFSASNIYPLTVVGKNNFTGEIPITLTVSASSKQIAMNKVNVSGIKALAWTGGQLKPDGYKVKYNKDILSEQNGDYTVSLGENISVGTGTLTLTGTGMDTDGDGFSYIGTKTVSFKITGTAMNKISVSGVEKSYTYTGASIEPDAVLTYKVNKQAPAISLIKDIHYTVAYQKNWEKGTATIIFTGIESNGYTGTKKQTFKIISSNIDNAQGTGSTGKIDVVFKETNRIENGVYIAPYMKGGAKPEVIVTSGGKTLKSGKDYTISYTNNRKVALSTDKKAPAVLIKGKGNYAGSKKVYFSIVAKELSNENGITVKANDKIESPKKNGYRQAFKVYDADGKALGNTDYDSKNVTYTLIQEKNADGIVTEKEEMLDKNSVVSAGTVIRITVQGKGIYAGGSATGTYRILEGGHNISKATIQINNQTYTGNPVIITEQGQFKSGKVFIKSGKQTRELILGQDIEVVAGSYVNNTNKGTAKVTFRGINEYGGTKTVSYKIGVRSVSDFWKGVFSNISKLIS